MTFTNGLCLWFGLTYYLCFAERGGAGKLRQSYFSYVLMSAMHCSTWCKLVEGKDFWQCLHSAYRCMCGDVCSTLTLCICRQSGLGTTSLMWRETDQWCTQSLEKTDRQN